MMLPLVTESVYTKLRFFYYESSLLFIDLILQPLPLAQCSNFINPWKRQKTKVNNVGYQNRLTISSQKIAPDLIIYSEEDKS